MIFLRRASSTSLVALLALVIPLHALDLKSLKPQGYLSDFANVVDPQSRAAIDQYAGEIEHATGAQLSLVTLKTLDGDPLEDVSIDLFRQFGIGQKNKDNGVQLLLVTDDRRSRLETGNGLEALLPDGLDGQILLDMRPQLQAGNYGAAILAAAQRIGGIIAKDRGVQVAAPAAAQPGPLPGARPAPRTSPGSDIPWGLLVFIVILLIGMFRRGAAGRRYGGGFWPGFLLGNVLGGGWSGTGGGFGGFNSGGSSGGFGGSSSSGGFGGFGGGDAGGGGASSSW